VTKPFELDNLIAVLVHWSGRGKDRREEFKGSEGRMHIVAAALSVQDAEPTSGATALPVAMVNLPLIDMPAAMARMEYTQPQYFNLLELFFAEYSDEKFPDLSAADPAALKVTAHALKGVAKNVGLEQLADAATALHGVLTRGAADVSSEIAALDAALKVTLLEIRRLLA
jgi:HPt (histidine-containing phosphotransfer) domain-containing protein